MLNNLWTKIKNFFHDSETIFLARLQVVVGFIVGLVGVMDWSPLLGLDVSSGFSKTQVMFLGSVMIVKGILDEFARKYRATDL